MKELYYIYVINCHQKFFLQICILKSLDYMTLLEGMKANMTRSMKMKIGINNNMNGGGGGNGGSINGRSNNNAVRQIRNNIDSKLK